MFKVGIIGARGFTGGELVRILLRHPGVSLSYVTSESHAGESLSDTFPTLLGQTDLKYEAFNSEEALNKADVFIFAMPEGEAMKRAPQLLAQGAKIVDLSGDFRLKDAAIYQKWYKREHVAPDLLGKAVYGLPELHRSEIKSAQLVANPGCYPTSSILALAPLMKEKALDPESILVDSKSGVSGAGGRAAMGGEYSYPLINDSFRAYGLVSHRHTPEIEQELGLQAGTEAMVQFTPHLVPMTRGILSTAYAEMTTEMSLDEIQSLYENFYKDEPFVQVLPKGQLPQTKHVCGSNHCHIGMNYDSRTHRVIVVSAIDNLVKGAAGQAVQNMNLLCGLPETQGIDLIALYP